MPHRRTAALLVAALLAVTACRDGRDEPTTVPPSTSVAPSSSTTRDLKDRYVEPVFDEVEVTRDVIYGRAPGVNGVPEDLKLDVYQPKGDTEVQRAAIVFVHGGAFRAGSKQDLVASTLAREFAERGYVTASIDYRLLATDGCSAASVTQRCTEAVLAAVSDGQAAVRFVRAHAAEHRVDPERIGIGGDSAGAIVALGAGVRSETPGESGTPGVSSTVAAWMSVSGGLPGAPFVGAGDAPGILFAGTADTVTPYEWSKSVADALARANVPHELVTYEGAGHVPVENREDIISKTTAFFAKHLARVRS
jgi:acetyl esterase/lipase